MEPTKYIDNRLKDIGVTREDLNSEDKDTRYKARVKLQASYPNHLITIEFQGGKQLNRPVIIEGLEVRHEYHSQLPAKVGISPSNQVDRKRRFICFKDKPKQPKKPPVTIVVPSMARELQREIAKEAIVVAPPEPQKLSSKEAADYLGVNNSTLSRAANAGKIPFTKKGNRKFYLTADLDKYKGSK